MLAFVIRLFFILSSYACFTVYTLRSYTYCRSILTPVRSLKSGRIVSLAFNYLALSLAMFCALPVFLCLMIVYFLVLIQFLYAFRDELISLIFVSGTFLFHLMNVKMSVTSIFILLYAVPSYRAFRESSLIYSCTFVTALLLLISLEVFQKAINFQMMQTLMRTPGQLQFVTSSMMLINVYLLILSVSYGDQALSGLVGIFLLSTSLLLFGAFYTSFRHAVKMSVLLENEGKSRLLEEQLQATQEDVEELQAFAFTDTLTAVHNRRYGLDQLDRLIEAQIPFCLCFLDIDHLKYVNDTFGHEEGDRYILDVVKVLSGACRKEDTLSRMGGDEFMLLLPQISRGSAVERLREIAGAVSRIPSVYHPSVSYGIAEAGADAGVSAAQILRTADREMYRFKQASRSPAGDSTDQIMSAPHPNTTN